MRKISDTIARLAALKKQPAASHANGERSKRFSLLSQFGSNPGSLIARSYIPENLREGSPLVVVLHGCTQTAIGYDYHSGWSQLADEAGFALLYAEQQRENNPNLCFNWFIAGDTQRHSGEAQSIQEMVDALTTVHSLDRGRIFVTGLSAGGAMAAAMLATYPELFAGGAIIAGLPFGVAKTVPEAFDRMRGHGLPAEHDLQRMLRAASDHKGPWPRISIWHGSADQTVAPSNAEAVAAQWRGVHLVGKAPPFSSEAGARSRQVWCNTSGVAVIESNMIARMGHGTPIGAGLGSPGPFMLDVGISSTREIAAFWGIAEGRRDETLAGQGTEQVGSNRLAQECTVDPGLVGNSRGVSKISGVQKTIEDALRTAGLMR